MGAEIIGIGTDIVDIARIEAVYQKFSQKFLARIFTRQEQENALKKGNVISYYAKRFAAKEACFKACGFGIGQGAQWLDIEITATELGQPILAIQGRMLTHLQQKYHLTKPPSCHISVSDTQALAQAFVILTK